VKKPFLSILIVLIGIVAFGYAGSLGSAKKAAIENKIVSSLSHDSCKTPAFHFPHAEMEIFSVHGGAIPQGTHNGKKLFGYNEPDLRRSLSYHYCLSQRFNPVLLVYTKSYLSHIYPSHNFW
jgi:hypothetical protein